MSKMPRAVILAGGKGTRLQPFTLSFPKPLVPIGDMPIIELLLRSLYRNGIRDVTLTVGHMSELIRAYISQRITNVLADMEISFVEETEPTGTAGSLALVPGLNETFLAMNSDLLTNLDYAKLLAFHRESGAELTIASHVKKVKIDLGIMDVDDDGRLIGYTEKPEKRYNVSMGIYVYEPSVLDLVHAGEYFDFPDLVWKMLAQDRVISVYPHDGLWLDVGRPEDYALAQEMFEKNRDEFVG
jgi:NDP-mannose synthase